MIIFAFLTILGGVTFSPTRQVTGQSNPPCPTCSQPEQRTIYVPTIGLPEAESADIVLNCRSAQDMDAIPTFYTVSGEAIVGDPIHMQPSEMRFVTVDSLIPEHHRGKHVWGGMSFSYTGRLMELWAQITLRGRGHRGSSDVVFSTLNNTGANLQEAVWWMPTPGKAMIALGNSSDSPIHTQLQFSNGDTQEIDIAPFATHYVRHSAGKKGNKSGFGQSVKLNTTGPAGSLKATGYVISTSNDLTSSIRFYETPNTVQPNLFANNFRVKDSASHLLLKNTSEIPIMAEPHFRPTEGDGLTVDLPAVSLAPGEIKELDLQPLLTAAADRDDLGSVSVKISNSGMRGSLIGSLYSKNTVTGVSYDPPVARLRSRSHDDRGISFAVG